MIRPDVSPAAERAYAFLAAYHEDDERTGWTLLHLMEAIARTMQKVTDAVRHDELGSGARRMLSPSRSPEWRLPSLAENYAGIEPRGETPAELRARIKDRPRFRRCTPEAMKEAVRPTLTGTKAVRIFERVDGKRSRATLITRTGETPDPDATYRAALTEKRWGLKLAHLVTDEVLIGEATLTFGETDPAVTLGNAQPGDV